MINESNEVGWIQKEAVLVRMIRLRLYLQFSSDCGVLLTGRGVL
jgi:hypothetical protein